MSSNLSMDSVVTNLASHAGMAVLDLDESTSSLHKSCFVTARRAFQVLLLQDEATHDPQQSSSSTTATTTATATTTTRRIQPNDAAAHVTGYHEASEGLSRYNAHRRGFVFSNGGMLQVQGVPEFESQMNALYASLHAIAQDVLNRMELEYQLPSGWFQEALGPTFHHSQWHVKQFVTPSQQEQQHENNDNDDWLPMHTDPSIISVVIHDAPGKQEGALGLQYQHPSGDQAGKRIWTPVPHHGHAVATVLVGSVLSYMTGGRITSCKHRVCHEASKAERPPRMAATLFLRPRPTALMTLLPTPMFAPTTSCASSTSSIAKNPKVTTFEAWSAKVSRNYTKQKRKQQPPPPKESKPHTANKSSNKDGYYRDKWTEVSLLPCDPPLTGREKFLGGELGNNGKIYTIPGHAHRVVVIDPTVEPPTVQPIGPAFSGEFKWLRGVRMSTGIIYGIPCHADYVLKIDPATDTVSIIEWDEADPCAPKKGLPWKWHGGNIGKNDGCLYCIPQFAEYVLKIDPITETTTFLPGNGPLVGRNKWYGGLISPIDGAIYGINQNSRGVLRIDPLTQDVTVHGDFPEGRHLWHGGVLGPDGCIYGIPAHADSVLKIHPGSNSEPPQLTTLGGPLRTGAHRSDGKYKYLGGAVGHDGNIYLFPSDADFVLQINPKTEQVQEVGPNLRDLETIHHNKWQNGFTAPDGTIYGIPLKSQSILRIRPGEDGSNPEITTIGGPYPGLNKWEGGVMSKNGDMFCMPLNHNQVLRMKPIAPSPEKKKDKQVYVPQTATLRSSAHTLRYSKVRAKGLDSGPAVSARNPLPPSIRVKQIIAYEEQIFDLRGAITNILARVNNILLGGWENDNNNRNDDHEKLELEAFVVPLVSLQPRRDNHPTGRGEEAQQALSDLIASDEPFLSLFDDFLSNLIVPWMKRRLVEEGVFQADDEVTFYYQRPPTLRIQPGPGTRYVRPHKDSEYGHQDGELNFWMPLTDPTLTQTDLWVETTTTTVAGAPAAGTETVHDHITYVPLGVKRGEVAAFHGSSQKHYVPANPTPYTRVSLDFRVGVKGFFDPSWTMLGTVSDHYRREIKL